MPSSVTSPAVRTFVNPCAGFGLLNGKNLESDGCTSASIIKTRSPMSASKAPRLAVSVVFPTPPFVLITVNLIIGEPPMQRFSRSAKIVAPSNPAYGMGGWIGKGRSVHLRGVLVASRRGSLLGQAQAIGMDRAHR